MDDIATPRFGSSLSGASHISRRRTKPDHPEVTVGPQAAARSHRAGKAGSGSQFIHEGVRGMDCGLVAQIVPGPGAEQPLIEQILDAVAVRINKRALAGKCGTG